MRKVSYELTQQEIDQIDKFFNWKKFVDRTRI